MKQDTRTTESASPPREFYYVDGNGSAVALRAGSLRAAPECGAGFYAAQSAGDGRLVVVQGAQLRERKKAE